MYIKLKNIMEVKTTSRVIKMVLWIILFMQMAVLFCSPSVHQHTVRAKMEK